DYVHRIGRTARHAASGRATSFVEPGDRNELLAIERLIGRQLPRVAVPREHPVFVAEVERRKAAERNPGVHGGRTRAQLEAERLPGALQRRPGSKQERTAAAPRQRGGPPQQQRAALQQPSPAGAPGRRGAAPAEGGG